MSLATHEPNLHWVLPFIFGSFVGITSSLFFEAIAHRPKRIDIACIGFIHGFIAFAAGYIFWPKT